MRVLPPCRRLTGGLGAGAGAAAGAGAGAGDGVVRGVGVVGVVGVASARVVGVGSGSEAGARRPWLVRLTAVGGSGPRRILRPRSGGIRVGRGVGLVRPPAAAGGETGTSPSARGRLPAGGGWCLARCGRCLAVRWRLPGRGGGGSGTSPFACGRLRGGGGGRSAKCGMSSGAFPSDREPLRAEKPARPLSRAGGCGAVGAGVRRSAACLPARSLPCAGGCPPVRAGASSSPAGPIPCGGRCRAVGGETGTSPSPRGRLPAGGGWCLARCGRDLAVRWWLSGRFLGVRGCVDVRLRRVGATSRTWSAPGNRPVGGPQSARGFQGAQPPWRVEGAQPLGEGRVRAAGAKTRRGDT